jgi:hypothetical protein
MSRQLRLGAAIAVALLMLAAACSSSHKSDATATTLGGNTVTTGTGVPVTNRNGTPLTAPGGVPITLAPGSVAVTAPNGSVVTVPGGTPVTRSVPPTSRPVGGGTTTPPPAPMRWKLGLDFRTHPDHNPFPRYSGGTPVWTLMQSQSLQLGNYTKLTAYAPSYAAGLAAWHGTNTKCGGLPAVGVAILGPARVCGTATVQPQAVFLIPDSSHLAVVAWKSPVTRNIAIQTGLADFDPSCGDGVRYTVASRTTTLAAGTLANGGSKVLPTMQTHVNAGETVYFAIGPGASGNADCDTTQLAVTITTL